MLPPVQPYLFRFVYRTDQKADPDRQQLNVGEGNADITRDDQPFVEDTVQNVDQVRIARGDGDAIHSFQETAGSTFCQLANTALIPQDEGMRSRILRPYSNPVKQTCSNTPWGRKTADLECKHPFMVALELLKTVPDCTF
jgi:hypothetical protein